jgi:PPOX class probable F420-dependent enzyme
MPPIPPEEALTLLAGSNVGILATVRPDGSPHVVPFVFAVRDRTLYWAVDRKPKRTDALQRLSNIRANPRVEVLVHHYEEDWSHLWWVRAAGLARLLDPGREARAARDLLVERHPQYRSAQPMGPFVAVDLLRWSGWTASTPV